MAAAKDYGPKLGVEVVASSGEDEGFPVAELLRHTRNTRGWHSPKLCEFPQEVIFRFQGEAHVQCIRLLAHESKIPVKIDIYTASVDPASRERQEFPPLATAEFTRLGFLSFSDNEQSRLQVRELKTARVSSRCCYLKLVMRNFHPNAVNVFNQVALVAVAFHGELTAPFPSAAQQQHHRAGQLDPEVPLSELTPQDARPEPTPRPSIAALPSHPSMEGTAGSHASEPHASTVNTDPGVGAQHSGAEDELDPVTAKRVRDLSQHKARAVAAEDYDLAKVLKEQIDALRTAGSKIADLERQKAAAVEQEDYDVAKVLKRQIDELRSAGTAAPPPPPRPAGAAAPAPMAPGAFDEQPVGRGPSQEVTPAHDGSPLGRGASQASQESSARRPSVPHDEQPVGPASPQAYDDQPVGRGSNPSNVMSEYPDGHNGPPSPQSARPAPAAKPAAKPAARAPPAAAPAAAAATAGGDDELDERPVQAGQKTLDQLIAEQEAAMGGAPAAAAAGGKTVPREAAAPWEHEFNEEVAKAAGEHGDPEPLPAAKRTELKEPWATTFGAYGTACLFGKKWQLRDAAMRACLSGGGFAALTDPSRPPGHGSVTHVVTTLLTYVDGKTTGLNDSVAGIFFTVCDVVKAVVGEELPEVSAQQMSGAVAPLLPGLLLKAGDTNQRVRERAQMTLLLVAMSPMGCDKVAHAALHDPQQEAKKPLNFRVQLARLSLVRLLVEKLGLATRQRRTGLTADGIMGRLVVPQLPHTNADVREAAIALTVLLMGLVPPSLVEKSLAGIKPAQRTAIDDYLRDEDKVEAARAGVAQAPGASPTKASVSRSRAAEGEIASSSIAVERGQRHPVVDAARAAAKAEAGAKAAAAAAAPASARGPKGGPQPTPQEAAEREAKTCQFCGKFDKRFDDRTLDLHYVHACPLLCPCPLCGQITEIPLLQEHLVQECDHCALVKQCPLCREAVRAADLDEHVAARACIPYEAGSHVCPLCHDRLPATDEGWDRHFLQAPGCGKNPRKWDGGNGKEFTL